MTSKRRRSVTAGILVLALLAGTVLTGFTYQGGIDSYYYETQTEIFDGSYYYEQLGGHQTNGIERNFFVTSKLENSTLQPYVFAGEITGKYSLDSMISYIEAQGYTVVSGINGDLFDTASGTPKGLTIHDGLIKSSGYAPEYVISFDKAGKASLGTVNMQYTVNGTINVPTVTQAAVTPAADGTIPPATQVTTYVQTPYTANIGYVNVPHGAGKALHFYNRQYASSTKVTENSVEVVIDTASAEAAQPSVGGTIKGTVVGGKGSTTNTPIGDNQIVLSAAMDSPFAAQLGQLAPGTAVEITTTNNGSPTLNDSKECIGIYYLLYDNGQYVATGTNLNPRTCIGIKADGTTMMYTLDGRQAGWSTGLGLTDVAEHMIALGCTTVVNLDGGGSTMMATRLAGKEAKATLKNSPSDNKVQRKVTNGLFLVYKGKGNGVATHLHSYVSNPLVMPGASVQLSTYASDNLYEKAALPGSVNYSVDDAGKGSVNSSGLFTAGKTIGIANINAESSGITTSTKVDVTNDFTFNTNTQNVNLEPGKTFDINVTAYQGYASVASNDSSFTWVCDANLGTIDANGLFTAGAQSGYTGSITLSFNGKSKIIPVQVGVSTITFDDTKTHWAKDFIGKLAARGIVKGMGENKFLPDTPLTRAQFLTMLANSKQGLDVSQTTPAGFSDVPNTEWYYNYVNWGFANGIVKGMDEKTFAPNAQISREQMAVMLVNFAASTKIALPKTVTGPVFNDVVKISEWSKTPVESVVSAGIIGGYPDGKFDPQGQATRAQAATVIYKYCEIQANSPTQP